MNSQVDTFKFYEYLNPIRSIIDRPAIDFTEGSISLTALNIFHNIEYRFLKESGIIEEEYVNLLVDDSDPHCEPISELKVNRYEAKQFFKIKINAVSGLACGRVEYELEYCTDRIAASQFAIDCYNYIYVMRELLNERKFSNNELKTMVDSALNSFLERAKIAMRLHNIDISALKGLLIPKANFKSETSIDFEPIHWQGNVSQLYTLFADLMNREQLATTNGRAFINASPREVENFIFHAFRDKEGKELSKASIKTYLDPNHEKEVSGKKRIKPELRE